MGLALINDTKFAEYLVEPKSVEFKEIKRKHLFIVSLPLFFSLWERTHNVINMQPVILASLTEGLNLINRIIVSIITQPYRENGTSSSTGLEDVNYTVGYRQQKLPK